MKAKSLFDRNKSYNYNSFEGKSGIWKLIGVEAGSTMENTLDTFSNGKGDYKTFKREYVIEQADLGNIKPIKSSEVKLNTETKKASRRAI